MGPEEMYMQHTIAAVSYGDFTAVHRLIRSEGGNDFLREEVCR